MATRPQSGPLSLAPALAALSLLAGCKPHEIGAQFAGQRAPTIDNSWLIAANSCWPALTHNGYTLADMQRYLADPLHFRATFATYSALDNNALIDLVQRPVGAAPAPDTAVLDHSPKPVLTRAEAVTRTHLQGTLVAGNNGIAPPDSLCSIQPGLPVGFR